MKFKAEIDIMPLKSLLDPQGKAVSASMKNIDLSEIDNVRIGKHITLNIEADNLEKAVQEVLNDGLRTKDILFEGMKEVSTSQMGDAIISKLQ